MQNDKKPMFLWRFWNISTVSTGLSTFFVERLPLTKYSHLAVFMSPVSEYYIKISLNFIMMVSGESSSHKLPKYSYSSFELWIKMLSYSSPVTRFKYWLPVWSIVRLTETDSLPGTPFCWQCSLALMSFRSAVYAKGWFQIPRVP